MQCRTRRRTTRGGCASVSTALRLVFRFSFAIQRIIRQVATKGIIHPIVHWIRLVFKSKYCLVLAGSLDLYLLQRLDFDLLKRKAHVTTRKASTRP